MTGRIGREERPAESLFSTFFMAGFECSTFIWKDRQRKDFVALTGHDRHLPQDYDRLMDLGVGVVREAIRWPVVDRGGGRYDWSSVDAVLEQAERCHITLIWDLCHYGFPGDVSPLDENCLERFTAFCRAAAERVVPRTHPHRFFTPVNEISFTSGACTDMEWFYPFAKGHYDEMKRALCRMAIEGAKAIREVDPDAHMVHVDPLIYETPPKDRPDLSDEAWRDTYEKAFEAWDILYGKLHPEMGGTPEILDIVGVNVYNFSQAQLNADGSRAVLGPRDPRRKPLSEMLLYAWNRYRRPLIIGETSGYQDKRAEWFDMTMQESLKALNDGIDLQGICLYPCVDIPDWVTGEWAKIGIFDIEDRETCERLPCQPYIDELRRWQKVLDRPENIEPDSLRGHDRRVQLEEVRDMAHKWEHGTPVPQKEAA
jgi:hypothetical protein